MKDKTSFRPGSRLLFFCGFFIYKRFNRAVVVERSNALVYLMISVILELKVEGSNPGVIYFRRLNKSNLNTLGQDERINSRNLDLR